MNAKVLSRISYIAALISFIIGGAFHGYRMQPENIEKYNLGVTMGIVMMSLFVVFLIMGIVFTILYKKKQASSKE